MKNLFENAYFGKAYKMRNGNKAIFHRNVNNRTWYLICEEIHDRIPCDADGTCRGDNCFDIISEWQEEINEEELDKFAYDYCPEERTWATVNGYKERDAFRAGYRKALNN